jgi:hypothetical protein
MGLRPTAQEKIVNTLIKLKSSGLAESTLRRVSYELYRLAKHCDLDNTDCVKNYIANMKGANSYKDVFVKTHSYARTTLGLRIRQNTPSNRKSISISMGILSLRGDEARL